MNGALFTVLVSGVLSVVAALGAVILTQYLGRKRDHEADWRKMKLETYTEYFTAFSEARVRPADVAARIRYLDAANKLTLVAPPNVLAAFYPYQTESTAYNSTKSHSKEQTEALNRAGHSFIRSMREDCHPPGAPKDRGDFAFQLYLLPDEMAAGCEQKTPPRA